MADTAGPGEPRLKVLLRERRIEAGLTQAQLADLAGLSRKTINTVENGVFVPSTLVALRIAAALNLKVEALFELE